MANHSPSERVGPYQGGCCAPVTLLEQNSPDKEMLSLRGCDNLESAHLPEISIRTIFIEPFGEEKCLCFSEPTPCY